MEVYTLYKLQTFIRRALALNLPEPVWISAELAECDQNRGHYYLQLLEKTGTETDIRAQARAILWQKNVRRWERQHRMQLMSLLQVGRKLQLQVEVQYHQRYGLSLQVLDIDPAYTLGQLAKDREQAIAQLKAEGLWELNRLTVLPAVPQRIAIISSPQAAGLQDFLHQLKDNPYGYHFQTDLYPAAMQGAQVSVEVSRQLRTLTRRRSDYDLIVLLRGGGARLDLAAFDELELARAIAQAPLPILSGIGHEQDQSIVDMLAHTSVKTPTAAAEFILQRLLHFEQNLYEVSTQLQELTRSRLLQLNVKLNTYEQDLKHLSEARLQQAKWQVDALAHALPPAIKQQLRAAQQHLHHLAQLQELLDVEKTLARGYSVVHRNDGIINSEHPLRSGDQLHIRYRDGEQTVEIK